MEVVSVEIAHSRDVSEESVQVVGAVVKVVNSRDGSNNGIESVKMVTVDVVYPGDGSEDGKESVHVVEVTYSGDGTELEKVIAGTSEGRSLGKVKLE